MAQAKLRYPARVPSFTINVHLSDACDVRMRLLVVFLRVSHIPFNSKIVHASLRVIPANQYIQFISPMTVRENCDTDFQSKMLGMFAPRFFACSINSKGSAES